MLSRLKFARRKKDDDNNDSFELVRPGTTKKDWSPTVYTLRVEDRGIRVLELSVEINSDSPPSLRKS